MQLTQRHAGIGRARAPLGCASSAQLDLAVPPRLPRDPLLNEHFRATQALRQEIAR
jgi:hypothetical protein